MVQVTGFEPTRLSTLEPETSASAVPPHLHFCLSLIDYTITKSGKSIALEIYFRHENIGKMRHSIDFFGPCC